MIRIYHHIWPFGEGIEIAEQQKNRLNNNIKDEFTYHESVVLQNENECHTLIKIIDDLENYNDDDYILYFHTKGASGNKPYRKQWREYMEMSLIDDYKSHIDALDRGYDTSGILMGIPNWSENCYGGNFWWTTVKYMKKIPNNIRQLIDFQNRGHAEIAFLQSVDTWKPHTLPCKMNRNINDFAFFMVKDMLENLGNHLKF